MTDFKDRIITALSKDEHAVIERLREHPKMIDEIEDLHALADECRAWAKAKTPLFASMQELPKPVQDEFKRLAKKLDEIAKRLAARLPT